MTSPIITLLTDFGTAGPYAAAVKGAILGITPSAAIVDITNDVPPQDIHAAAFILGSVYRSFPPGTIHLAVVDPGVGTARRPLLLVTPHALFVGPDNGIFTYVLRDALPAEEDRPLSFLQPFTLAVPGGIHAYALTVPRYWRHPVSSTFHAHDIFGPVAAHLARGETPERLGEPVEGVTCLWVPWARWAQDTLEGLVLAVDPFGNAITNVPGRLLEGRQVVLEIGGRRIHGIKKTYAEGDGLLAVVGSHGLVEVSVRNGNAARVLGVGVGHPVWVRGGERTASGQATGGTPA
ncbi:MAG: SAM-dependent chlorinase/fluorinase [Chloroflexi bacterium]|nr:SAM-dependent chlorinase/fluorinase [Chloroflexota bacterium]